MAQSRNELLTQGINSVVHIRGVRRTRNLRAKNVDRACSVIQSSRFFGQTTKFAALGHIFSGGLIMCQCTSTYKQGAVKRPDCMKSIVTACSFRDPTEVCVLGDSMTMVLLVNHMSNEHACQVLVHSVNCAGGRGSAQLKLWQCSWLQQCKYLYPCPLKCTDSNRR